jgi:hypothetical protein
MISALIQKQSKGMLTSRLSIDSSIHSGSKRTGVFFLTCSSFLYTIHEIITISKIFLKNMICESLSTLTFLFYVL